MIHRILSEKSMEVNMDNEEKDKLKEFKGLTNNEVVISRKKKR